MTTATSTGRKKNAPKSLPILDDARESIQQFIADNLVVKTSESGNEYFGLLEREMPMTAHGVTGRLSVSWFGLRDATEVEAKRAATVTSDADTLAKRMTLAEKAAYAKRLLDEVAGEQKQAS